MFRKIYDEIKYLFKVATAGSKEARALEKAKKAFEVIEIEGIKKESDASGEVYGKSPEARATSNSEISIAELLKIVKGDAEKYIPKTSTGDSAGGIENQDNRSLSPEQEEYFKDSVVRDEKYRLKVMCFTLHYIIIYKLYLKAKK